jgi:hypothetical protein
MILNMQAQDSGTLTTRHIMGGPWLCSGALCSASRYERRFSLFKPKDIAKSMNLSWLFPKEGEANGCSLPWRESGEETEHAC